MTISGLVFFAFVLAVIYIVLQWNALDVLRKELTLALTERDVIHGDFLRQKARNENLGHELRGLTDMHTMEIEGHRRRLKHAQEQILSMRQDREKTLTVINRCKPLVFGLAEILLPGITCPDLPPEPISPDLRTQLEEDLRAAGFTDSDFESSAWPDDVLATK